DISALARLSIGTTQAQVAVSMEGETGALPSPPGLSGLHLEQFGLAMGVFFAPPGLNLGLQGRLRVGQEQLKDDQFGLVLQMVGAVPNILYLSFYVEEMSLGRVITLFTDEPAPRAVQALELVEARALSFYWAQGQVVLPDGTVAQPGLGLSGQVRVFGLGAYARCRVQADTGLVGEATSSPVDLLGVLKVEGDGKGITRQLQRVEGRWVPVDNRRLVESRPPLPTKEERIVAPGGPVFKLTSQGSPFLHLSWRVSLFELQRQEVEATVSSAGIQFSLEYALAGVQSFILRCTLADWSRLAASVDFGLGVDVRLGPIKVRGINCGHVHLQSVVAASLSLALEASRFDMEVRGQFDFAGATLEFPTLRIQDPFPALEALPGKMVQRLREQAADLFGPWFSDVGKWSELVGRGLVTGFEDLGQVLKGAFNQSHQDAAKLMKKLGKGAAEIAGSLRRTSGLAAEEVAKLLRELGFDLDAVGEALGSAYGYGAELLSRSLKSAGFSAKQVGGFLKSTKRFSDKSVKKALGAAGYSSKTVSKAMGDVFGGSWKRSLGRLF
ncbi:MAG TPA: hypothetical protein VLQ93_06110, partial [Myxococcaceae bacterium]|nr:hypothetical protein [Myxococcaceae bacterium]